MNLYTAEIQRIKNEIEETGEDEEKLAALRKYENKRELAIHRLMPSAIAIIKAKCDKDYIIYKGSGAQVCVKSYKDKYRVYGITGQFMEFSTIEAVAEFLIVSEDLFV